MASKAVALKLEFEPTIKLAERLMAAREKAQEGLLLLFARLDAIASNISSEGQSNRDSFTSS